MRSPRIVATQPTRSSWSLLLHLRKISKQGIVACHEIKELKSADFGGYLIAALLQVLERAGHVTLDSNQDAHITPVLGS